MLIVAQLKQFETLNKVAQTFDSKGTDVAESFALVFVLDLTRLGDASHVLQEFAKELRYLNSITEFQNKATFHKNFNILKEF